MAVLETSPGTDTATKSVFTTGEAAAVCKVSQQTIIRCFDSGRLIGFRVPGSKFRRIPREELIRFMRENNIPLDTLEEAELFQILLKKAHVPFKKGLMSPDRLDTLQAALTERFGQSAEFCVTPERDALNITARSETLDTILKEVYTFIQKWIKP